MNRSQAEKLLKTKVKFQVHNDWRTKYYRRDSFDMFVHLKVT